MSSPRLTQGDNSKSHEWHSHLDLEKNESLVPPHTRATLNDHAELRPRKAPNGPGNTDWKLHSGVNEGLRGTKRVISDEMIESKTQSNTKTPETTYAMCQNELYSMAVIGLDAPLDSVPDMEMSEIKFREHRDSVAVARSRMSRNGILLNQREGIPIIQIDRQEEISNAVTAKWEPLMSLDPAIMTSPLPMRHKGSTSPLADFTDDIWGFGSNIPGWTPRRKLSRGHRHIVIEH